LVDDLGAMWEEDFNIYAKVRKIQKTSMKIAIPQPGFELRTYGCS
jgi:hypothetical protein